MNQSPIARIIVVVALILIAGGALTYALIGRKPMVQVPDVQASSSTSAGNTDTSDSSAASSVGAGNTAGDTTGSSGSTGTTGSGTSGATTSTYKDGTYSAVGSYISPGGDEKIGVTVTLKNDIITSASVTPEPVSPNGRQYQGMFQASFQPLVVGKNIADVHLTKVSGSSLTSGGFNQALAEIEAQAKA
jgi:hypothetical protein